MDRIIEPTEIEVVLMSTASNRIGNLSLKPEYGLNASELRIAQEMNDGFIWNPDLILHNSSKSAHQTCFRLKTGESHLQTCPHLGVTEQLVGHSATIRGELLVVEGGLKQESHPPNSLSLKDYYAYHNGRKSVEAFCHETMGLLFPLIRMWQAKQILMVTDGILAAALVLYLAGPDFMENDGFDHPWQPCQYQYLIIKPADYIF